MLHLLPLWKVVAEPVIRKGAKPIIFSSLTLVHIGQILVKAEKVVFSFSSQNTGWENAGKEEKLHFFLFSLCWEDRSSFPSEKMRYSHKRWVGFDNANYASQLYIFSSLTGIDNDILNKIQKKNICVHEEKVNRGSLWVWKANEKSCLDIYISISHAVMLLFAIFLTVPFFSNNAFYRGI